MLGSLKVRVLSRDSGPSERRHARSRTGFDRAPTADGHYEPIALSLPTRGFKRLLDLCLAPMLLLFALPVLLVSVVVIRLESRGPGIFRQVRVGERGRPFRLYKLRTMRTDTDDAAHREYVAALVAGQASPHDGMFKLVADPRVTRVGRFLRRFSLDELPQLWNVIRGDMSLVGPRPPLPNEVELYDTWAWQRMSSKPGITGLWQVSGRCQLSFGEMVDLDIRYLRDWTPLLELKIIVKSPVVVISRKGAA